METRLDDKDEPSFHIHTELIDRVLADRYFLCILPVS